MTYAGPVKRVEDLFQLLARTPTGQAAVDRFLPRLKSGRVRIEGYPLAILEKLKEITGPDQPIGACFVQDNGQGVIYLDMTAPVGVLAPFLLHEIIHSLDARLWVQKPSQRALLEAETSAFNTQRDFVEELGALDPAYSAFLASRYPKARILHERMNSGSVAELYGFEPLD